MTRPRSLSRLLSLLAGLALAASAFPSALVPVAQTAHASASTHTVSYAPGKPDKQASRGPALHTGSRQTFTPNPQDLALAAGVFSPATFSQTCQGVLQNSGVDDAAYYPRSIHSANYETWGRITGYCETSTWSPAGSEVIEFDYDAHVFSAASGAQQAWNDGSTYFPSKYSAIKATACPTAITIACTQMIITFSDNSHGIYWELQYGQCLQEERAIAPNDLYTSYQNQMNQTLLNIGIASANAARAACAPRAVPTATSIPAASFTILATVEPENSSFDPSKPGLTEVVQGTTVRFVLYREVQSETPGCQETGTAMVTHAGSTVLNESWNPRPCPPASTVTYNYFNWPVQLTQLGTYTYVARDTIAGQTKEQTVTINVVAPPPPSYQLQIPSIQNSHGQTQTSFRVGQHGRLVVRWEASNVPSGGIDTTVRFSIEVPNGRGGWKVLVRPTKILATTHDGENTSGVPFTAQRTTKMRFIVAIHLLGAWSRSQMATITIHR